MLFALWSSTGFTQKQLTTTEQIWLGSTSQLRFSNHWGGYTDFQLHSRKNYFEGLSQASIRLGAFYYFNDDVRLGAGYALNENFYPNEPNQTIQPEHNPWQQVSWTNRYRRLTVNQSIRQEERFRHKMQGSKLVQGYTFNYRTRYNIFLNYPLTKKASTKKAFDAVMYNEVYINFGKQIVYNSFDQYRLFAGLNYHVAKQASILFGYLDIFQQLSSGRNYRKVHTARIFYLRNFDLRKKHPEKKQPPSDIHFPPYPLS